MSKARHRATARRGATSRARARLQIAARTRPRPASSAHVAVTTALSSRAAVTRRRYHGAVVTALYHGAVTMPLLQGALITARSTACSTARYTRHRAVHRTALSSPRTRPQGYTATRLQGCQHAQSAAIKATPSRSSAASAAAAASGEGGGGSQVGRVLRTVEGKDPSPWRRHPVSNQKTTVSSLRDSEPLFRRPAQAVCMCVSTV